MGNALELSGQRFGRLFVLKRLDNNKWGQTRWLCECDCGKVKKVTGGHLVSEHSQSCGCLKIEQQTKHGHAKKGKNTKTYNVWLDMKYRCNNSNNSNYKNYGARGITVCQRWEKFKNFLQDMGEHPKGLTIDRIDNNGNYEPGNCKWSTYSDQNRNNRGTKLTTLKVQVIRNLLKKSKLLQREIGEIFNVAPNTISQINTRNIWA